jgi:hypothetical protein
VGTARVWTYDIKKAGMSVLQVNVANKTVGPSISNLGGLTFCNQPGRPTTTAVVLSDIDENPTPITPGPAYDYRHTLKVISLDGTPAKESASLEVRFQYGVVPRIGFSPDCSIIAGWGSLGFQNHRSLGFVNGLSGVTGGGFEYDETAPTTSFTATATVSGANIVTAGAGQTGTVPAP